MLNRRRLPLKHAHNVRDLGGYPVQMDKMIAWHKVYRSDNLHALDDADWQILRDAHISLILDLRSEEEIQAARYDSTQHHIQCHVLPFMKSNLSIKDLHNDAAKQQFLDSMKLDYVAMMLDAQAYIKAAMEDIALILARNEAVLFHCTAGKDRTGILAVLLLDLCGVDERDILADYQVSQTYNELGVNQMLPKEMMEIPQVKALFESRVEMMKPLLDFLHETSTRAYLLRIGVDEETLDCICTHLIVSENE